MNRRVLGLHHITAIAGDPQRNLDFYTGILGLRLVKKTVNFDDPYTYHFYYGDEIGHPGTLLTFFPRSSDTHRGRKGTNQLTGYAFSINEAGLDFWMKRLKSFNIEFTGPAHRFNEEVIAARDHDGFEFELVASPGKSPGWDNGEIPSEFAIQGFHGVTILERSPEATENFLTRSLGFQRTAHSGDRTRFETGDGGTGTFIDLLSDPDAAAGSMGVGIIHHVAWRTPDDAAQLDVRKKLVDDGLSVTPVIDRNYFHSIYFNEPGGVIFEIATDPPGFLIDEQKELLGRNLMLPHQYEPYRAELERVLPALEARGGKEVELRSITERHI